MTSGFVGIIVAEDSELSPLRAAMSGVTIKVIGPKEFYTGLLNGVPTVLVKAGIGRSNAAATTALLCSYFKPLYVFNCGSSGSLSDEASVGDIVISTRLSYADVDNSCLGLSPGQVPEQPAEFLCNNELMTLFSDAAVEHAKNNNNNNNNPNHNFNDDAKNDNDTRQEKGTGRDKPVEQALEVSGSLDRVSEKGSQKVFASKQNCKILRGRIVTTESFCASIEEKTRIQILFPDALAIEMEGAAVAQICASFKIRFLVVRAISDGADDKGEYAANAVLAGQRTADIFTRVFGNLRSLVGYQYVDPPATRPTVK